MRALEEDFENINDSEISERFPDIKEALMHLDLIVFIPITQEHSLVYTEEDPIYRKAIDENFKKIYWDEILDIFPDYNYPKIIEVSGSRSARLRQLDMLFILIRSRETYDCCGTLSLFKKYKVVTLFYKKDI